MIREQLWICTMFEFVVFDWIEVAPWRQVGLVVFGLASVSFYLFSF